MSYRDTMPMFKAMDDSIQAMDDSIHHIFWRKSDAWEYEREWRLMYPRANAYVVPGLLVPSGIIFGLGTVTKSKKLLKKWAPYVRCGQIVSTKVPYQLQIQWEDSDAG
jgi:hypothetical protein